MAASKGNQEIKLDSNNYRIHSDKNKKIIEKSLKEFGVGRSIVIDSNNEIIDPKYCQVIIDRMCKLDPTIVIKKNGIII